METYTIEVDRLTKRFQKGGRLKQYTLFEGIKRRLRRKEFFTAVDKVSFKVRKGEIFCLLGPNGAGKSTTMKMLSGLLLPDSGSAKINGLDVNDAKTQKEELGILLGFGTGLYVNTTVFKNLLLRAKLYGIPKKDAILRSEELIERVGLGEHKDFSVKELSAGNKQKFKLCCALLHRPKVLLLDEPSVGLDPKSSRQFWDLILELREKEGLTILLTTHIMKEVEQFGDRIAYLNRKIELVDTVENVRRRMELERLFTGGEIDV